MGAGSSAAGRSICRIPVHDPANCNAVADSEIQPAGREDTESLGAGVQFLKLFAAPQRVPSGDQLTGS